MTYKIAMAIGTMALSACAPYANQVGAAYVSPLQYEDYSCRQILAELNRVSHKVAEVSGAQDSQATGDAVAMGVGLVIFWPALFFIGHGDQHIQLSDLKGEYDALRQAVSHRECGAG